MGMFLSHTSRVTVTTEDGSVSRVPRGALLDGSFPVELSLFACTTQNHLLRGGLSIPNQSLINPIPLKLTTGQSCESIFSKKIASSQVQFCVKLTKSNRQRIANCSSQQNWEILSHRHRNLGGRSKQETLHTTPNSLQQNLLQKSEDKGRIVRCHISSQSSVPRCPAYCKSLTIAYEMNIGNLLSNLQSGNLDYFEVTSWQMGLNKSSQDLSRQCCQFQEIRTPPHRCHKVSSVQKLKLRKSIIHLKE